MKKKCSSFGFALICFSIVSIAGTVAAELAVLEVPIEVCRRMWSSDQGAYCNDYGCSTGNVDCVSVTKCKCPGQPIEP
jgi:hypothetical protein